MQKTTPLKTFDIIKYHKLPQTTDMQMLYDINPIFSIYINKLSAIYLFLTLLLIKLFFTGHGKRWGRS